MRNTACSELTHFFPASQSRNTLDEVSSGAVRPGNRARDRANPLGRRPGRALGSNGSAIASGDRNAKSSSSSSRRGPAGVKGIALRGSSGKMRARGRDGIAGGNSSREIRNSGTIATLKQFLASRWQEDAKYLNLDVSITSSIRYLVGARKRALQERRQAAEQTV